MYIKIMVFNQIFYYQILSDFLQVFNFVFQILIWGEVTKYIFLTVKNITK